jgi:hypothetical protein
MEKMGQLPGNIAVEKTTKIYQDIIALLDKIKNSLAVSKLKLKDLLINFESLKGCWGQALESLQACLKLKASVDQAANRWGDISDSALDYSQQIQERIQSLMELTEKIQAKTNGSEVFPNRYFDHMVIEVDETKRRAEDVLLEGLK